MPNSERLDDMPLVDRLKRANYLTRELSEHLKQAYLPSAAALRTASRHLDVADVSDQEVLDCTLSMLEAEDFTADLYKQLTDCLQSIRVDMKDILHVEEG